VLTGNSVKSKEKYPSFY